MKQLEINPDKNLDLKTISAFYNSRPRIILSEKAKKKIRESREFLDQYLSKSKEPVYGINTGFGSLYDREIPSDAIEKLQENLVMSHACGMGKPLAPELVRLMLLFKIHSLAKGFSGVSLATVQGLADLLNEDIIPVVYENGSLGASGDLAPLAHMALPLLGLGEVYLNGEIVPTPTALKKQKLKIHSFRSKEALALLNGTQFMTALGAKALMDAGMLSAWSDITAAVSLEAFDARPEPFDSLIQDVRPHPGQKLVAARIQKILRGSKLFSGKKTHVQDPYSFRCIPQVHGASLEIINNCTEVFLREINSVTDNPTVFPEAGKIISGGNFHGQILALSLDQLSLALAELGSISERRTYQLISGTRGLPPFLVKNPGLNSGFMIPQYTAASMVSLNKQLASPSSVDSIVSSNGQEDHVSMGANAALRVNMIAENVFRVLAIELITAFQALDFRDVKKSSSYIQNLHGSYREKISFLKEDKVFFPLLKESERFIRSHGISE
jgi:histidine ammonia-lyase